MVVPVPTMLAPSSSASPGMPRPVRRKSNAFVFYLLTVVGEFSCSEKFECDDLTRQARDNHIRSILGASDTINRSIIGAS
eukprot:COSAG06_NODE_2367_length_7000_cov_16.568179_6_plen_80_part_00